MKKQWIAFLFLGVLVTGCNKQPTTNAPENKATQEQNSTAAGPLPDNAFKAQITLVDPPAKMRTGEKVRLQVKIKNASDVFWWSRGGAVNDRQDNMYYLAAGNRWLSAADNSLVTDMDGRYGISKDLKPGDEAEIPLLITAPGKPGDYILDVDLVQEQVAWFHDKGSPTAQTKVSVVK
jgi:hypothetical protein